VAQIHVARGPRVLILRQRFWLRRGGCAVETATRASVGDALPTNRI
jgi:hypothetical protein